MFRFAAAVSTQPDPQAAVGEACHTLANQLETTPSLVVAFVSAEYQTDIGWAGRQILSELRPAVLAGCLAESVLANGREVEGRPAVALMVDNIEMAMETLASKGFAMVTERDLMEED